MLRFCWILALLVKCMFVCDSRTINVFASLCKSKTAQPDTEMFCPPPLQAQLRAAQAGHQRGTGGSSQPALSTGQHGLRSRR